MRQHVGQISWTVEPSVGGTGSGDEKHDLTAEQMLQVVRDNEFGFTQTQVIKEVGGNKQKGMKTFNELKANGLLVVDQRDRQENGKTQKRDFVGLGPRGRRRPVPALGTDQETGSR